MKNIFLTLALLLTVSFSIAGNKQSIEEPHIIITTCGATFEYDDAGMTDDQNFELAYFMDDFLCGKFIINFA